jgi:hypothetical protein
MTRRDELLCDVCREPIEPSYRWSYLRLRRFLLGRLVVSAFSWFSAATRFDPPSGWKKGEYHVCQSCWTKLTMRVREEVNRE